MKTRSIRFKIMGTICIILALVFCILSFIVTKRTKEIVVERENLEISNFAYEYGVLVKDKLENAYNTTKTLASSVEGLARNDEMVRTELNNIQRSILEDDDTINAIWILGETNAIDGRDIELAGKEGELNSGRYVTFFAKDDSIVSKIDLDKTMEPSPYFYDMKNNRNSIARAPYIDNVDGRDVFVTSLVCPIEANNKFIGVAGIDMYLDSFQKFVLDFVNQRTDVSIKLLSSDGQYIASSDESLFGKSIETDSLNKLKEHLKSNSIYEDTIFSNFFNENINRRITPITVGDIKTSWILIIETPVSNISSEVTSINISIIGFMILALLGILIAMFFVMRQIINPLKITMSHLKILASGDFTSDIPASLTNRRDEFGELGSAVGKMQSDIKHTLSNIKNSFERVEKSTQEVADMTEISHDITSKITTSIQQISASIVEQANDTETISEKSNDLGSKIEDSSNIIAEIVDISSNTSELTQKGMHIMKLLDEKTEESNNKTKEVNSVIKETNKYANNAEDIISLIDSVAEQTNLLALNASIEAARAGEAGKGFAVVADEIRKLSVETSSATNEIKEILTNIQLKSNKATTTMSDFENIIDAQNETIASTDKIFHQTANQLDLFIQKINTAKNHTDKIYIDKDDIIDAITTVSAVTEETAASSEEISNAAYEQSSHLEDIVNSMSEMKSLIYELEKGLRKFKI